MEIIVQQSSILEVEAQAVVNPANSLGQMRGGIAAVIASAGGPTVEQEAMAAAPISVGAALVTTAGEMHFDAVIHAPTMTNPADLSDGDAVYRATLAAAQAADAAAIRTIAMPGMGTGVGGVAYTEAASQMICALRDVGTDHLSMVVLVDISSEMVDAWRRALATTNRL